MSHKQGFYEKYIKRPQDFLCAAAATIVLSPVMGATALLVRKKLGTPVLFTQDRPGLNGKVFKLYKFRSMTDERDEQGNLLPDDVRLTSFGKKLRSTSLDELPELFNILKGDMAVVGPRPLLVQYLNRYNEHQARRHEVRPGFTGLAQVHGRNAISWEEKFDWDVKYVDNITFLGDWSIIFATIKTVLKREGISAAGEATMSEFMGKKRTVRMRQTMYKNVWILNHYAGSMFFDHGGRHYWFAKYLKKNGYSPCVFCSNSKHGIKERWIDTGELFSVRTAELIDTPFIFVKSHCYSGNGFDRIVNMVDFYYHVKKAAVKYAAEHGKPDIILASSVHPLTMVAGIQLAKKFGIKCICEVRDLWPEAIVTYSKRIKKNSLLAKIMYAGERWIYTKADAVVYTQEGGPDYVCEHGWDRRHGGPIANEKMYHINNGVDLEEFNANIDNYPYPDKDLDNPDLFKVVYTGAVRRINNLGLIVDAAKLVTNPKIIFLIFGDGDELESLRKRVAEEKLDNIVFKGRVGKYFIPSIVSKADLNLVHWEMSPLLRVGESYNKAFEYFAAGKPVFYTIRPGYSIVEKYHCGRLTDGFEPENIAAGIQAMAEMSETEKMKMAENMKKTAQIYDFKNLTKQLINIMESI